MLKMLKLTTSIALCSALALPAVAQDQPGPDTVVATVNGHAITLGQMINARAGLPPQYQQLPDEVLFSGVLDQLIQQQVLADTMEGEPPLRVRIALENEERLLLAGEVVQSIVEEAVTDESVQAFYDENVASADAATEYNASHILVATLEEAEAALERLAAGEEFAALATELSQDPGAGANGGSLGWVGEGMLVAPFEAAVMALEVGAVSEPVETQFGFHIITLNDTREQEAPPLDAIRADIEGAIREQAIQDRLAELTEAAEIVMPEEGAFDPALLTDLSILRGE